MTNPETPAPMTDENFDEWIRALSEDVIQEGFGYEPGEFTVYPELWRAAFDEGLTPIAAFTRALDAVTAKRSQDDLRRTEDWKRIQAADLAFIQRVPK